MCYTSVQRIICTAVHFPSSCRCRGGLRYGAIAITDHTNQPRTPTRRLRARPDCAPGQPAHPAHPLHRARARAGGDRGSAASRPAADPDRRGRLRQDPPGPRRLAPPTSSRLYPDGVWLVELRRPGRPRPRAPGGRRRARHPRGAGPAAARHADRRAARDAACCWSSTTASTCSTPARARRGAAARPARACASWRPAARRSACRRGAWRVPRSSSPVGHAQPRPRRLAASEAVRLFVERVRPRPPGFALTDENAPTVAAICRRLDGMPLALELAAARASMLPARATGGAARRCLAPADGRRTDGPPRQQTLRATLDWSYRLLTEEERTLLRRLSVFAGGWISRRRKESAAMTPSPGKTCCTSSPNWRRNRSSRWMSDTALRATVCWRRCGSTRASN